MLVSKGIENSSKLRLKELEPDNDPSLRFGVRSLDDSVGGFKYHDFAVLYGSRYALTLAQLLAVRAQRPLHEHGLNSTILLVDAGCSFEPYGVSSFAQSQGMNPRDALERIYLSRAFTVYQLSSLIYEWLPRAIEEYDAKLVIISALFELFTDPDIPRKEILPLFHYISKLLSKLALKEETVILVAVPYRDASPKMDTLLKLLKSRADIILELEERLSQANSREASPNRTRLRGCPSK
jgi:hypothetical protein